MNQRNRNNTDFVLFGQIRKNRPFIITTLCIMSYNKQIRKLLSTVLPKSIFLKQFFEHVLNGNLQKEVLTQVWHKQDDQFKLPKACVMFELFSPIAYLEPQSANKVYMFTG